MLFHTCNKQLDDHTTAQLAVVEANYSWQQNLLCSGLALESVWSHLVETPQKKTYSELAFLLAFENFQLPFQRSILFGSMLGFKSVQSKDFEKRSAPMTFVWSLSLAGLSSSWAIDLQRFEIGWLLRAWISRRQRRWMMCFFCRSLCFCLFGDVKVIFLKRTTRTITCNLRCYFVFF